VLFVLSILAAATSEPSALRLAATSTLAGQFSKATCGSGTAPLIALGQGLAGAPADALKLDAGDLMGTAAISRIAIDKDAAGVAAAIVSLGYKALAIGHRDLAAQRSELLTLARELDKRGLTYTLSNLRCDAALSELCDAIIHDADAPLIIDHAGVKVAFVAAVAPAALEHAAKDRTRGLSLLDPAQAITAATLKARAAGAEWVVAAYDPKLGEELEDAIAFAQKLDPVSGPDVVLVQGISERVRLAVSDLQGTTLVATRPLEVLVIEQRKTEAPRLSIAQSGVAPNAVQRFSDALGDQICRDYEKSFAGAALETPLDREGFASLFLDVMRETSKSEVAVINRLAVSRRAPYPFVTALTPLALMQALPFDNTLRTTVMRGDQLVTFASGKAAERFYVRGLVKKLDGWYINDRAVDTRANYKVVTTDFVADGGHGGLSSAPLSFDTPRKESARELLGTFLDVPREGDVRKAPIDPAKRTRWTLSYRLQLDVTNVTVVNPDATVFTDTQLARGQSLSIVGETEFRAFGDHPAYTFENQVRLRFGLLKTITVSGDTSGFIDNVDLIAGRSLFFYRRIFGTTPKWYHPLPYADLYVESEFTRPAARSYHHLGLQGTAGVRFEIARPFAVYVGGGFTWETLATAAQLTPPAAPLAGVLVAGWQLRPFKLVFLGDRPIELETNLDAVVRDIGAQTQSVIRGRVRLAIPIFSVFSLTTTYDVFLRTVNVRSDSGAWSTRVGYSGDIYLGLQVSYSQALQAFAL
jgi:hypothetical protein